MSFRNVYAFFYYIVFVLGTFGRAFFCDNFFFSFFFLSFSAFPFHILTLTLSPILSVFLYLCLFVSLSRSLALCLPLSRSFSICFTLRRFLFKLLLFINYWEMVRLRQLLPLLQRVKLINNKCKIKPMNEEQKKEFSTNVFFPFIFFSPFFCCF